MKSSSGAHYIGLDHIRALAALMVFVWHFVHSNTGMPISYAYVPEFPLFSLFEEGHTGVALFMVLSGYLFAKLLNGKKVDVKFFLFNRALRLLPLLMLVIVIVGVQKWVAGENILSYTQLVVEGAIYPTLPNGGWSITVEFHFYLLLPVFLWLLAKSKWGPLILVVAALILRYCLWATQGEVQWFSYWTIVGRIDQFALGMVFYYCRGWIKGRHVLALATAVWFVAFYHYFNVRGGYFHMPSYPSPSRLWVIIPTMEALGYGLLITWYDNSFQHSTQGVSKWLGRIGEYSYSIYLLHFFVVFQAAGWVSEYIMPLHNFYQALLWGLVGFLLMLIPAYFSYRFIELPFLKFRRGYIIHDHA